MYYAEVPIEVIAKIFGHTDTRTTVRYLRLDFGDMGDAMVKYARYRKGAVFPKVGIFDDSQGNGGRIGI